ncbi:MAG TPA: GAF domain-containing sensor histidine kinase [Longimicrobium sp.]|nr:GAF domain-containing sensor histidine kinase [Longimicrobium sp.]
MLETLTPDHVPADRRQGPYDRRDPVLPHEALDSLVRLIEYELPEMRGSILLLDSDGLTLRHGAAPNLPPEYCRAIDGSAIGPTAGSCGTAAYHRRQVIVTDIATDPLWQDYRDWALPFGLRACWSTPIVDDAGSVLGTFAMYYGEPREPDAHELGLTRTAAMLACNIIVRARTEAALRESEAKMRAARAEAERANRAKAAFLAMMSHELRTPLNAIGGYAALMLDGIPTPASDAQRDYLRRIVKAQEHLLGLIEAVLTHARLEAGRMTYRIENVPMRGLIEEVESLSRPQMAEKGISCDSGGCDGALVLHGDRQKCAQILLNLLSNAVKFTPANGRITLRTDVPAPGRALIGVRDTGIGMTAEQLATVFEAYVQFDNPLARPEKGTGLGLAISRELASGMGGDLTVVSEPGAGTEFRVTLPLGPGAEASAPLDETAASTHSATGR